MLRSRHVGLEVFPILEDIYGIVGSIRLAPDDLRLRDTMTRQGSSMTIGNDLDNKVMSADPAERFDASADSLDEIFVQREKAAGKRRAGHRAALGAGIAGLIVLVTGIPVAATALHDFFVQDVDPGGGAGAERVPGSENVDTSRSDIRQYIESIYPDDLPLPQGYTRESVVDTVVGRNASDPGPTQSIGLTRLLENVSYCGWVGQWLDADTLGDQSRRNEAAGVMADSLTWRGYTATDGGGVIEAQRGFAEGAAAGDRHAVLVAQSLNACSGLSAAAK